MNNKIFKIKKKMLRDKSAEVHEKIAVQIFVGMELAANFIILLILSKWKIALSYVFKHANCL